MQLVNRLMISEHQILNILAENVRFYRKQLKISQEELAFRSGLHRTYIGMVERAEKRVSVISLEKLSEALGVSYNELLTRRGFN